MEHVDVQWDFYPTQRIEVAELFRQNRASERDLLRAAQMFQYAKNEEQKS